MQGRKAGLNTLLNPLNLPFPKERISEKHIRIQQLGKNLLEYYSRVACVKQVFNFSIMSPNVLVDYLPL